MNNIKSIIDNNFCSGCGACMSSCPKSLINMNENSAGFIVANISKLDQCIECGICLKKCSMQIQKAAMGTYNSFYGWMKNKKEICNSTSGGVFAAIAKTFIEKEGIVVGASMDLNNKEVKHVIVEDIDDLKTILKSKYVQSNAVLSYSDIKTHLENNTPVLFSGSPCQVYGLKKFLDKEYTNLYTIDFICHGVPSKKLFFDYINDISKKYGNVYNYDFRCKDCICRSLSTNCTDFQHHPCRSLSTTGEYMI